MSCHETTRQNIDSLQKPDAPIRIIKTPAVSKIVLIVSFASSRIQRHVGPKRLLHRRPGNRGIIGLVSQRDPRESPPHYSGFRQDGAAMGSNFRPTKRIVVVDLAGFAKSFQTQSDERMAAFIHDYYVACEQTITRRGGEVIKFYWRCMPRRLSNRTCTAGCKRSCRVARDRRCNFQPTSRSLLRWGLICTWHLRSKASLVSDPVNDGPSWDGTSIKHSCWDGAREFGSASLFTARFPTRLDLPGASTSRRLFTIWTRRRDSMRVGARTWYRTHCAGDRSVPIKP